MTKFRGSHEIMVGDFVFGIKDTGTFAAGEITSVRTRIEAEEFSQHDAYLRIASKGDCAPIGTTLCALQDVFFDPDKIDNLSFVVVNQGGHTVYTPMIVVRVPESGDDEETEEDTAMDAQEAWKKGFSEGYAAASQGLVNTTPDPCAGCSTACGNIACPKRIQITY